MKQTYSVSLMPGKRGMEGARGLSIVEKAYLQALFAKIQGKGLMELRVPFDEKAAAARQLHLDYPIVYTVLPGFRAFYVAGALILGPGLTYLIFRILHGQLTSDAFAVSFCSLSMVGCAYMVAWAFGARITLYADRFEVRGPLHHRAYQLSDIIGRRYALAKDGRPFNPYVVTKPKFGLQFDIDWRTYNVDERFVQWFLQFPDLDAARREKLGK